MKRLRAQAAERDASRADQAGTISGLEVALEQWLTASNNWRMEARHLTGEERRTLLLNAAKCMEAASISAARLSEQLRKRADFGFGE